MYAEQEQKICTKCGIRKSIKSFSKRNARSCGYASSCKECLNQWRRIDKTIRPDVYRDYEHERGLRRNYNMSSEEYCTLLERQNGKCACCGTPATIFKRRLHVDHSHKTGQVRSLLCTYCNPLIGFAKEDIQRLEMASNYLKKFLKAG